MRTWEAAVELLQARTQTPDGSAEPEVYTLMMELLDKLHNLPPLPKSNWKKLVQQMQVCPTA
jgi:hypothetical protein